MRASFWSFALIFVLCSLLLPFKFSEFSSLSVPLYVLTVVLAVGFALVWLIFNQAMTIESPPLVGVITGSFPVITVLIAVLFLGEHLAGAQLIAVCITLSGVIIASADFRQLLTKKLRFSLGVRYAFVSMLGYGVIFALLTYPTQQAGWFVPGYIFNAVGTMVLGGVMVAKRERFRCRNYRWPFASGLLSGTGTFANNAALSVGSASIVIPLAGSYPIIFVIVSRLMFKDPVSRQQAAGIVLSLVGIVLISLTSS